MALLVIPYFQFLSQTQNPQHLSPLSPSTEASTLTGSKYYHRRDPYAHLVDANVQSSVLLHSL